LLILKVNSVKKYINLGSQSKSTTMISICEQKKDEEEEEKED